MATAADIGIDLGTANVLIYVSEKGIVWEEPSVVAIDNKLNTVLAVGTEARRMIGRTPSHIDVIRPLKDGVISNYEITEKMLSYFIEKIVEKKGFGRFVMPRIMVCVPTGVTEVEKRAVEDATKKAGAREVYIIEEPIAAAIGAGINITEPFLLSLLSVIIVPSSSLGAIFKYVPYLPPDIPALKLTLLSLIAFLT